MQRELLPPSHNETKTKTRIDRLGREKTVEIPARIPRYKRPDDKPPVPTGRSTAPDAGKKKPWGVARLMLPPPFKREIQIHVDGEHAATKFIPAAARAGNIVLVQGDPDPGSFPAFGMCMYKHVIKIQP